MTTPRQASAKEVEENKRKQEILRSHGYSQVKVDGSWGPWQEARYRAIQGLQDKNLGSKQKASVGVISLPAVASPAMTTALPIMALIGSGYMAAQNWNETAPVLQALTAGVTEPILRTYDRLSSYFYPEEATPATGSQTESSEGQSSNTQTGNSTASGAASSTTSPASPEPERNDSTTQHKPSFRERLGDRIAGRNKGQTPPNNNQNRPLFKRIIWETEQNNFGDSYWRWRNAGRLGLAGSTYPAREYVWPNVSKGFSWLVFGPKAEPGDSLPEKSNNTTVSTPTQQVTAPTTNVEQPDSSSFMDQFRKVYGDL